MSATSYPFLTLARQRDLNYGHVLLFADVLGIDEGMENTYRVTDWTPHTETAFRALGPEDRAAVAKAVAEEENRRAAARELASIVARSPVSQIRWDPLVRLVERDKSPKKGEPT